MREPAKRTLKGVLSEKTLMPVSLVIVLGGIIFWASSIAAHADLVSEKITRIESREAMFLQMREDVTRISTRVDMIYDRIKAADGRRRQEP